jgi:eukaryotic-like serine/threonine-protein kinase
MAAGADPFVGKLLAGTYHVVRLIGKGGMGAIYEATHTRLQGKRYAIKVLAPQFTEEPELLVRFRREAEIASQLGHDNIVAVHDFNVADGQAYMVMELLEGEDLAARLSARGALPVDEVKRIVDHVASALDSAHRAQIVHRDLKPQNIFLCRRVGHHDHVKVLDFGISKVLDSSLVVTRAHALIGTPFYMSPEQADGRVHEIDARTDVFALGAIAWEMLTGRMAFAAPTLSVALYKVCSVDPLDVHLVRNDVPPALSLVLRRALAKERQARTPSVVQMAAELAASLHGIVPAGLPLPAYGGQVSASGFASLSHSDLSMAVAGTAASVVPPPQPGQGWPNPISASPMAPSGALAPAPRVPGLLPTMPSLSGAPLAAVGARGADAAAPGPRVSATGSIASPPVERLASAPGMSSLAVGSVMVERRSWGRRVAAPAGVTALVLGLAIWAATSLGATGSSTTPASPTAAGAVAANPPTPSAASGTATSATGVGGAGATGPGGASPSVRVKPSSSGATEATIPSASASAPTEMPSAVPPPTAPEVALFLIVEPAGAKPTITVGDRKVTDRLVHVPRSATPLMLTAEARGFVTYHGDVLPDRDQTVAIVLKRKAAKTVPARTPTTRSPAAATRTAPAASSPTDATKRAAQESSPPYAAKRGAPAPAGFTVSPGPPSSPTGARAHAAALAGSPQAGEHTATPAPQQVPAAPPRPAVPLPPPPPPPKKKTTIFDQ